MQEVSLYNSRYEKIFDIDWKKAILLLMNGKVISCTEEEFIDIKTTSGIFKLPKHIALKKYVYIPHKEFSPTRKNIFRRDQYTCQYCSRKIEGSEATIDHVLPRSRGGKHRWDNVVACCLTCNRKKGDKTPIEAKMNLLCNPKPLRFH
jgi:CRISPR/Cas system Type II protein with McrA/HNH and RuvC-like nuclease domain